jgi:hypothetical protein
VVESRPLAVDHLLAGVAIEIAGRVVLMRLFFTCRSAWRRHPSLANSVFLISQSVDIGGIALAATAGVMKVLGYRVFATGAQWLAAQ